MNKMVIEYWPTAKLIPYARNPRKNDQAVDRMAASIEEFGFRIPILRPRPPGLKLLPTAFRRAPFRRRIADQWRSSSSLCSSLSSPRS